MLSTMAANDRGDHQDGDDDDDEEEGNEDDNDDSGDIEDLRTNLDYSGTTLAKQQDSFSFLGSMFGFVQNI